MTDDELIARLRSMHWCVTTEANGVGISDDKVALAAADRIEQLMKNNHRWKNDCEEFWRKREDAAEAKLAKAMAALTALANMKTAVDSKGAAVMAWHAREMLNQLEKTE